MEKRPEEIERELEKQQNQLSPGQRRANLLTLVILCGKQAPEKVRKALAFLAGKRAARIIIVFDAEKAENDIQVSATCANDYKERGICFQEIRIYSDKDKSGFSPVFWAPFLVRDLPVYIWTAENDCVDLMQNTELRDNGDLLIFESAVCREPNRIFTAALQQNRGKAQNFRILDLTWQRQGPLRNATYQAFSEFSPEQFAPAIKEIALKGFSRAEAALYLGWFASRLGWKLGQKALNTEVNTEIPFSVDAQNPEQGRMCCLFSLKNGQNIRATTKPGECTEIYVDGTSEETVPYHIPSYGEVLLSVIDMLPDQRLYTEALAAGLRLFSG